MIEKLYLLFNTVKHLKPIQVFYQLKYRIIKAGDLFSYNKAYTAESVCFLLFQKQPPVYRAYVGNNTFSFLNLSVSFKKTINWNYQEHGKLWNYNLQYANYLLQEDVSVIERKALLLSLYEAIDKGQLPLEPYPVSLRSINSIRFLSQNNMQEKELYSFLHAELDFLSKRPEYHLLGNHLLENSFALLMGGAFFTNQTWIKQGQQILKEQLEEQILNDGAHFELSPMYHQIIFFRLLELIDWYSSWKNKESSFLNFLMKKACKMRSWLAVISFKNGAIPHFNDSTNGIAYSTPFLLKYADKLSIKLESIPLSDSGYRSYTNSNYECKVDVAQVGPSYQPGHAHADSLHFIINVNKEPIIVDSGVSTYEKNERRHLERSTSSHNTVTINNTSSSQVWGGFRMAKRAKITLLKDEENVISAMHDGYRDIGVTCKREVKTESNVLVITDTVLGHKKQDIIQGHLHLHPNVHCEIINGAILLNETIEFQFPADTEINIAEYLYCNGFNDLIPAKKIIYTFIDKTTISINFL